ncbi:Coenzyme A disulfide reductase [Gimesia panareensis]|uniref:Coenzyme A disulfide reductase n=1 Tax=Gimesia panareensis TaxID=2527978 RepID=A0A517Q1E9_9PLAN|nr:FAD-dependent oxidoreductase [Gimesia panareensis]QDT25459.1 Coenzyme A disulfide reductase [Gimesia panareensis]
MSESQGARIIVVGGVAGGASAAARARRCNERAEIILFEKDEYVSFANCGLPYFIGDEIIERNKLLVATPELFKKRFNIDVRTRHLVQSINVDNKTVSVLNRESGEETEEIWDRLILSTGAAPITPPIPGIDAGNVFTLRNLNDADAIKAFITEHNCKKAVVVGAGFIGLEMVEQLHHLKLESELVELQPQVLPPLDPELARLVQNELTDHDIKVHLGTALEKIQVENGNATGVELGNGTQIDTDVVILGIGVSPAIELAKAAGIEIGVCGGIAVNEFMQTSHPEVYAVGDAIDYQHGVLEAPQRIPLAGPANRAGRIAGQHAASDTADPMISPMGTAIVRVFGLTAAITGLSKKSAERNQRQNRSIIVVGKHHAGYFPGAQQLFLKLTYDPETGRILGAQSVGREGVDKRIDVIATALKFKGTVRDLTGVDLCYAPPFGSAKDPIHMAAFVACNDLDELTRIKEVDADLSGFQIVDVRSQQEVDTFRFPDITHIPVDELRGRLHEVDASRPIITVCHTGMRAYVAARILQQSGFENVHNLTGGMLMQRYARPELFE